MVNNSDIAKFYLIQKVNSSLPEYLRTTKTLKIGRIYNLETGKQAKVIRQVHFKYSLDDIQNLVDLLEGGYNGTQQHKMWIKMRTIKNSQIPKVRFSDAEKEMIYYIYVNEEYNTDEQRKTLEKVLNIRR